MRISEYIIGPESSILEAMKQIDRNAKGIVYLCEQGKLAGVLTDGDVRRYLLQGGDLRNSVREIANHSPKYIMQEERNRGRVYMKQYQIRSLPVLDADHAVKEILFLDEPSIEDKEQLNLPVAIMAGGKGTRLYPYTQILPKPLIPIGEKTITEHIMDRFTAYGCLHFDMIVNYKKNFIKSYFLENETPRDVSFIEEEEFLGTGGGLRLLRGRYASTFFMSNCDILVEADYAKMYHFHKEQKNLATMVCAKKHLTIPYGTVEVSGQGYARRLNEKPEFSFITNTGLYLLEPEFLEKIPDHTFIHITDVIQACIDQGKRIGVYSIPEDQWMDMGQMDELERMKRSLHIRE